MKKFILLIMIVLSMAGSAKATTEVVTDPFHPQGTALRKLERGVSNTLLGGLEFFIHLKQPDNPTLQPPWFAGIAKGFYKTLVRTASGVYEMVTFPLPLPKDYLPMVEPEFIWNYHPEK